MTGTAMKIWENPKKSKKIKQNDGKSKKIQNDGKSSEINENSGCPKNSRDQFTKFNGIR